MAFLPPVVILLKTNLIEKRLPNFKSKMNFEEILSERKTEECDCTNPIRGALLVISLMYLVMDCFYTRRTTRRINELKAENETLKTVILRSVDQVFMKMMKNGNDFQHEHEE